MATQGSNSGTGPGPNMATLLNPDRRPQRLFRKTQVAMIIADHRING